MFYECQVLLSKLLPVWTSQKCHSILEETMEYKTDIGREGLQIQYLMSVRLLISGNSCHVFIACVTRLDPYIFVFCICFSVF